MPPKENVCMEASSAGASAVVAGAGVEADAGAPPKENAGFDASAGVAAAGDGAGAPPKDNAGLKASARFALSVAFVASVFVKLAGCKASLSTLVRFRFISFRMFASRSSRLRLPMMLIERPAKTEFRCRSPRSATRPCF